MSSFERPLQIGERLRQLALGAADSQHCPRDPECCAGCGLSLDLHFSAHRSGIFVGCAGARFIKEWLVGHGHHSLLPPADQRAADLGHKGTGTLPDPL
jgi:hypothetical protein